MKKILLATLFSIIIISTHAQITSKREFRGVWVHVINQDQYQHMSPDKMKIYFTDMLDNFQQDHINAIIFQVRPTADAFYYSEIEPWSRFFSGQQGTPPPTPFDPMEFLINECHERNMEFHAWLNPYRVTTKSDDTLHDSHTYYQHPEWFVRYGKQIYFDPGLPECREHICKVVKDIISRYDVDAIHMDDYFYPYPIAGETFPDANSFLRYGSLQGFLPNQKADWRRNNVNQLIQEIHETINSEKPWVRFGISPFGIYRNKKNTPDQSGSETNGLQNYDDLYADIKLWVEKGWIDYNLPQIYWNIGFKAADYEKLIKWWSRNNFGSHLYIGQDISRTMNAPKSEQQLARKMQLERNTPAVYGNCFWPGSELMKNTGGIRDSLRNNYHRYPALIPAYSHLHNKRPKDIKDLDTEWTELGYLLHWERNGDPRNPEVAQYFVIYRFADKEKTNLEDSSKIVKITRETSLLLPYASGKEKYKYVVTSVDRFHNESKKGKSKTVKL